MTDPRAVRVRLASESGVADDPAIEVAPVPEPLHMTNPTVGTGPFGGLAITPDDGPDASVLAQRQFTVDGEPSAARIRSLGAGRYLLEDGPTRTRLVLEAAARAPGGVLRREVLVEGYRFLVEVEPERIAALRERATSGRAAAAHTGPLQVRAIIPGKVVAVSVKAGDAVTAGQQLLVVEAMKMQNELRAPRDGTVDRVGVTVGVNIEIGDLLVVIS
ncbi:MAG TPA: biotin/lipoyl-containing protein [Candidatus Limnocylindrales bacterium]|nr:biotin/lipoyl-containing protein [Candidatus Limnocylindrales bacterium]